MKFLRLVRSFPARILILFIELYRTYVSPLRLPTCRFSPTCSEYAVEALKTHGAIKGTLLAIARLLKCAPWHSGGWDPVPDRGSWRVRKQTSTEDSHDLAIVDEQRST
ncbi:membrane protein insertion efficiency factor YidD [Rhodococcus sp. PAMC28707]|uniref:membrane protein insertion efficiency factor YidD n=1 Tax=unclassified Rhodococcus (in: high G+C Gram-positive bacteria) TaxID=192944 RepID=UPI00109DC97D|nr:MULTISPECIES: membrane protein insertion efficiency factor YidD [unclassified Rhodococcus (in: high G+C Gram-positive bacteria)]QCB49468.1 membrane protein insertion efficiency factor YidD [Rhodococcus sp. PAMC28705]QCB58844.1 membrane protein insertion efficiency factor YidD [Rhodococcus sp. PAMC28707]